MTGAVAAAKIAGIEPRPHGRKDSGKGQPHFDAAMKAARPGGQAPGQARASAGVETVAHRKTEAKPQETAAGKTPSLAEVLHNALHPVVANKNTDTADAADDRPADNTDADDPKADTTGWMNQARFDAAIWKALGPDAGGTVVGETEASEASIDVPTMTEALGSETASSDGGGTAGTSPASPAIDGIGKVAKIDIAATADVRTTGVAVEAAAAAGRAAVTSEATTTDGDRTAPAVPAQVAATRAVQTTVATASVATTADNPPAPQPDKTSSANVGTPVVPAPASAVQAPAPPAAPQVAATVAVLSAPLSEQRGPKLTAREPERAPVIGMRAERNAAQTVPARNANPAQAAKETGDLTQRSNDDRISVRTTASDTRDAGRPLERQAPDVMKPSITVPVTVTQHTPQQQVATPAGSVVAALGADPAWSAYFRDTQPGAPAPVKSLKIQLNPSELGVVTAHLLAGDDGLSVELVAETTEAQHKLAGDSDMIARSLRAIGLDIDRVTVQLATRNDAPAQSDGGQPRGFSSESGAGSARGDGGGERNGQASGQSQSTRAGQQAGPSTPAANSGRYI